MFVSFYVVIHGNEFQSYALINRTQVGHEMRQHHPERRKEQVGWIE